MIFHPSFARYWRVTQIVLAMGLLGFVCLRWLDLSQWRHALTRLHWSALAGLLGLNLVQRLGQAVQGAYLFQRLGLTLNIWQVARAQWTASFYALLLPGDLIAGGVSWHLLSRDSGGARSGVASGLIYLRLLGYFTLVPFVLVGITLNSRLLATGVHWSVAAVALLLVLVLLPFFSSSIGQLLRQFTGRFAEHPLMPSWLDCMHRALWEAVERAQRLSAREILILVAQALAINLVGVAVIAFSARAVGIALPWTLSFWLLGMMAFIHSLPLAFAGTGLREMTIVTLLQQLYGTPAETSLLFSLLIYLAALVVGGGGGGILILLTCRRGKVMPNPSLPVPPTTSPGRL